MKANKNVLVAMFILSLGGVAQAAGWELTQMGSITVQSTIDIAIEGEGQVQIGQLSPTEPCFYSVYGKNAVGKIHTVQNGEVLRAQLLISKPRLQISMPSEDKGIGRQIICEERIDLTTSKEKFFQAIAPSFILR